MDIQQGMVSTIKLIIWPTSPDEFIGHEKKEKKRTSVESQGPSFAQVRSLEGNFSSCIENRHDAGFFLLDILRNGSANISIKLWGLIPQVDVLQPLTKVVDGPGTDSYGTNICHTIRYCGWVTGHPCAIWYSSAAPLIRLLNTKDYIWGNLCRPK